MSRKTARTFAHSGRLHKDGRPPGGAPLKERATRQQWEQIADITFHDLRNDFGHRLRASGFTLEEVAVILGHVTKKGTPAVNMTARYTQPNTTQMKYKLENMAP